MARLQKHYQETVVKQLMKELGYGSVMEVPSIQKITLSMGVKDAVTNKNAITIAAADLEKISGQKPLVTKARKSIAGFKIREGMPLGCKVTLRRKRMYEFLDRLINIVIPRIRDFRGLTVKAFDGYGNYSMGIKEQIVFPEIDYDKIEAIHGLNITITTNAKTNREAAKLLKAFNFPFKDNLDDKK